MIYENYNFWNAAIAGEKPTIHDGDVHFGYFKTKRGQGKGGGFVPVSFYRDKDIVCLRGNKKIDANDFEDEFSWGCKYPITHEECSKWYANGGAWSQAETPQAGIGHNSGELTPLEQVNVDIEALQERMKNAATKDALGDCKAIATKLKTRIEAMRKAEKEPHLKAGKGVDAKFEGIASPVLAIEKDSAGKLTVILRQEAEVERARVAKERAEREEQARLEVLNNPQAETVAIEEPKTQKITAGGNHGNKISLRKVEVFTVTNALELFTHYQSQGKFQSHALVLEALGRLALADLKAGNAVNGAKITIEERV